MICNNCDYAGRPTYEYPCSRCDMTIGSPFCCWEHEEVTINADIIRTMSDENLVALVRVLLRSEDCPVPGDPDCDKCFFKTLCSNSDKYLGNELEWLKLPIENGS